MLAKRTSELLRVKSECLDINTTLVLRSVYSEYRNGFEAMDNKNKRTSIPDRVKAFLRQEVGFGCPVKGCGNPYLEYHHFDPPVKVRAHNEPNGMIALCAQHHKKADGDLYTVEQLHALKADKINAELVRGNLDWLRKDLLAVVGGNLFYEVPRILVVDDVEVVALYRDADGYLRLNINMLSLEAEDRLIVDRNEWKNVGDPLDLRSPPQGKELEVKYRNGDYLHLRFFVIEDFKTLFKRYPLIGSDDNGIITYPVTIVEVNFRAAGADVEVTPDGTKFNKCAINGVFVAYCGGGICISTRNKWRQNPQPVDPRFLYAPNTYLTHVRFTRGKDE